MKVKIVKISGADQLPKDARFEIIKETTVGREKKVRAYVLKIPDEYIYLFTSNTFVEEFVEFPVDYFMDLDEITLDDIKISTEDQAGKLFSDRSNELCYIYSQGAYWRPEAKGYTDKIDEAGIYKFGEAYHKTVHCGHEKTIKYIFIKKKWTPKEDELVWCKFICHVLTFKKILRHNGSEPFAIVYDKDDGIADKILPFPVPLSELEPYEDQDKRNIVNFNVIGRYLTDGERIVLTSGEVKVGRFGGMVIYPNSVQPNILRFQADPGKWIDITENMLESIGNIMVSVKQELPA